MSSNWRNSESLIFISITSELSFNLHFFAKYSVTPILFFFSKFLLIGQLIIFIFLSLTLKNEHNLKNLIQI